MKATSSPVISLAPKSMQEETEEGEIKEDKKILTQKS